VPLAGAAEAADIPRQPIAATAAMTGIRIISSVPSLPPRDGNITGPRQNGR
jgi:hypothetical protein